MPRLAEERVVGADASAFGPDARLTAMWLWTLRTGDGGDGASPDDEDDTDDDTEAPAERGVTGTYVLEYDAARKIAQGLGAHLEKMADLVEVKGDRPRLLSAGERAPRLFGKAEAAVKRPAKARKAQIGLFDSSLDLEEAFGSRGQHPPANACRCHLASCRPIYAQGGPGHAKHRAPDYRG